MEQKLNEVAEEVKAMDSKIDKLVSFILNLEKLLRSALQPNKGDNDKAGNCRHIVVSIAGCNLYTTFAK